MISIVIPVKDAGDDLSRCLDGIARQAIDEEVEVVVVDSGSKDGSPDVARRWGARVHAVGASEFDHGATRNLGAELAAGDVLVFTTQDAYAATPRWLAALVAPLAEEQVAGSYGRQLPHNDAKPPERHFLEFLYGPRSRRQRADEASALSLETTLFSNVNSAIPRRVWERFRFAEGLVMSEDQEWAARVLLAGYEIRYVAEAAVRHSHSYTLVSAFRRFFDSGASAERAYLAGGRPSARALHESAARYARAELDWLWKSGQRRWIPYAAVYETTKLAGLELGRRHRRLPPWLKERLSSRPEYWRRPPRVQRGDAATTN